MLNRLSLPSFCTLLAMSCAIAIAPNNTAIAMDEEMDLEGKMRTHEASTIDDKVEHKLENGQGKKLGILKKIDAKAQIKQDVKTEAAQADKPFRSEEIVTQAELEGERATNAEIAAAKSTTIEQAGLAELVRTDTQAQSNLVLTTVTKPANGQDNTVINLGGNNLIGFEITDEQAGALGVNPALNEKETNNILLTTPAANSILDQAIKQPEIKASQPSQGVLKDSGKIIVKSETPLDVVRQKAEYVPQNEGSLCISVEKNKNKKIIFTEQEC